MILLGFFGFYIAIKKKNAQLREITEDGNINLLENEKNTLADEENDHSDGISPEEDLEASPKVSSENIKPNKYVATLIGIVHGVAGPGQLFSYHIHPSHFFVH